MTPWQWPQDAAHIAAQLQQLHPVVIALPAPTLATHSLTRTAQRQQVRQVLAQIQQTMPSLLLRSNFSHCPGMSLVGLVAEQANALGIGVDVLHLGSELPAPAECERLATEYLAPSVQQSLLALVNTSDQALQHAFASAWVAHEARLKARGIGLIEADSVSPLQPNQSDTVWLMKSEDPVWSGFVGACCLVQGCDY